MIKSVVTIQLIFLLAIDCFSQVGDKINDLPHFSKYDIEVDSIIDLFRGIVMTEDEEITKDYIIELKLPKVDITKYLNSPSAKYKLLIDEIGNVEAIYILESAGIKADEIMVDYLKTSWFRSLRMVSGNKGKYVLIIAIKFPDGIPSTSFPELEKEGKIFVAFDTKPEPIGGFEAIIKNLVYPQSAKIAVVQGKVVLSLVIDEEGNTDEFEIIQSLGSELDNAAIDAIKHVKWKPALHKGKPVKVRITIPIKFGN